MARTRRLKWREGVPEEPGFYWVMPDTEFRHHIGGAADEPRIIEVRKQFVAVKPELLLQLPNGRLEAFLFKGWLAGPIPTPIGPRV